MKTDNGYFDKIINIYIQFADTVLLFQFALILIKILKFPTEKINLFILILFTGLIFMNVSLILYRNEFMQKKLESLIKKILDIVLVLLIFSILILYPIVVLLIMMLTLGYITSKNKSGDLLHVCFYWMAVFVLVITPFLLTLIIKLIMLFRKKVLKDKKKYLLDKLISGNEGYISKIIVYGFIICMYISFKTVIYFPSSKQFFKQIVEQYLSTAGPVLYKNFSEQILEAGVTFTIWDCFSGNVKEYLKKINKNY